MTLTGICIPTVFCFLKTSHLDPRLYGAYSTKYTLEKKLDIYLTKLNYQQRYLKVILDKDLREILDKDFFLPINSALTSIQSNVKTAKENTRAEQCYIAAYNGLYNQTLLKFGHDIAKCLTELRKVYVQEQSKIEYLIEKVNKKKKDAVNVLGNCEYYGDLIREKNKSKTKDCIYEKLETYKKEVNEIEEEIDFFKSLADSGYSEAIEDFRECVKPPGTVISDFSAQAELRSAYCVKNVERD